MTWRFASEQMVSDFAGAVLRGEILPRGSVYAEGSGGVSGKGGRGM